MRGPATLTQLGARRGPSPGLGAPSHPEPGAGRAGRARRDPAHQGLRREVLLRHGARLRGGLHGPAGRRASAGCSSSWAATTSRSTCWPAALRDDSAAPDVITMAMGSLEGLIALRHGVGHVAGCHLFDAETGDFNRSLRAGPVPGPRAHAHHARAPAAGPDRARRATRAASQDLAGAVSARRPPREPQPRFRHPGLARPAAGRRRRGPRARRRLRGRGDDARRGGAGGRGGRRRRRPRHPARGERRTASTSSRSSRSATTLSLRASTTRASCSRRCSAC